MAQPLLPDRSRIELLPMGRNLSAWIRTGGEPDRCPRGLWTYRWRAFWFDINWASQERLHSLGSNSSTPLFVLGLWRSGTTYLHELLTASLGWGSPQTWQCFNPSGFLLNGRPRIATANRPMDAVVVDTRSPQEDEFVLLARGTDSAYRFFLDPRRWREVMPAISFERWQCDSEGPWANDLRTFLNWCDVTGHGPMVVKSPGHIFRVAALRKIWPDAKRVWIVRDPLEVWHSNLRMWHAMATRYALWDWGATDLTDFLNECFKAYSQVLERVLVNPRQLADVVVPYDHLVAKPDKSLRAIIEAIGLSTCTSPERISQAAARFARPVRTSIGIQPPAETLELLELIGKQHQSLVQALWR